MTAVTSALWTQATFTAKPLSSIGRCRRWEGFASSRARFAPPSAGFSQELFSFACLDVLAGGYFLVTIHKIHSLEHECRPFLRWKTEESSAAKATALKANVTGKEFLILPSPAIRKSL